MLQVRVSLKNNSSRDLDEIVQCYVRDLLAKTARPVKELKAFEKFMLKRVNYMCLT